MVAMTALGTVGAFTHGPFIGFAVYMVYTVLRPQFIWFWALPMGTPWSLYVALGTIAALALTGPRPPRPTAGHFPPSRVSLNRGHALFLAFGVWMVVCYLVGGKSQYGLDYMDLYGKIFLMYWVGWLVVRTAGQMWALVLIYALSLGYICYEVNVLYFSQGFLRIARDGYGGYDNNGAGLLLAMGVPLCAFAWEAYRGWYRWLFAALIPVIIHAVLMTYSRGAMLSMLLTAPFWILRGRFRRPKVMLGMCVVALIPVLAGKEIQDRFFSIQKNDTDSSAQSRFASWKAGLKIALDYPVSGVGVRCSGQYVKDYGADFEGRTIHNQYIQLAADTGLVGAGLYIALLASALWNCQRVAARMRPFDDPDSVRMYLAASGVQCSLLTFAIGAIFLSCEAFEPQYFLLFMAAQLPLLAPPGVRPLLPPPPRPA